jgi:hypothetical protein
MLGLDEAVWIVAGGLAGGVVLGLAARLGRFCIMGAVEDAVLGGDLGRVRMLALAAAVAIAGTAALVAGGLLDPLDSLYYTAGWSPAGAVLGGLMFGFGMAQVGTCGYGALARLGGGDLRALIMVIVIGIAAYATMAGPLSGLRRLLMPGEGPADPAGLHDLAGRLTGLPGWTIALGAAVALAGWATLDGRFRRWGGWLGWPVAVGMTVVLGWAVTSWGARHGFGAVPVESFSFTRPVGDTLVYAMTASSRLPGFAVASVAGVVGGAAVGSWLRGDGRWEACDDARELRRQMGGAALMGIGGVLAMGCTVGQGLSALSVLSVSAPLVIVSIMLGARAGLFLLVEGRVFQR